MKKRKGKPAGKLPHAYPLRFPDESLYRRIREVSELETRRLGIPVSMNSMMIRLLRMGLDALEGTGKSEL